MACYNVLYSKFKKRAINLLQEAVEHLNHLEAL